MTLKFKILIVNNFIKNISVVLPILKEKYHILTAENSTNILKIAKNRKLKPNLILLDTTIPNINSYDILQSLKSDEETKDIPVIFLISLNDKDNIPLYFKAGVVDCITIPIEPTILINRVKTHIQLYKQLRKLKKYNNLTKILKNKLKKEIAKQNQQKKILIQQSKMASMGNMIGAIAHNWRQPLNTISLIVQDILIAYEENELTSEYVEKSVDNTMEQIRFMSDTINDFRNFYKPTNENNKFNLKKAIEKILSLIAAQLKNNNINLELNFDENIEIKGNKNQFGQALINIFLNSKDAILGLREKGIISSNTSGVIKIETYKDSNNTIIKINDNGGGVCDKIAENMFNAYFTTKDKSIGTGIGLYITKMIIEENMRGNIIAYNNNKGLLIEIRIPNV